LRGKSREISALQTGLAGHFIKRRLTEFGASAALSDISVRADYRRMRGIPMES